VLSISILATFPSLETFVFDLLEVLPENMIIVI
jgi:hypothetical protein